MLTHLALGLVNEKMVYVTIRTFLSWVQNLEKGRKIGAVGLLTT